MTKAKLNKQIGKALRAARLEAGLTQREAAAMLGIQTTGVTIMESGRNLTLWTLYRFASTYNVSMTELVNNIETNNNNK